MFTARYELSPYIKLTRFVFKGLIVSEIIFCFLSLTNLTLCPNQCHVRLLPLHSQLLNLIIVYLVYLMFSVHT
jgi:hypothetical protein